MQLGTFMRRDVATIRSDATLQDAAQAMAARDVDLLMVLKDDTPVGVITDRDIICAPQSTGFIADGPGPVRHDHRLHLRM